MKKNKKRFYASKPKKEEMVNSLTDLFTGLSSAGTAQVSKTDTLIINNRYGLLFNNRQLLNQLYVEHGIVQTLIDLPVDDAFRGGINIHTKILSEEEIDTLQTYMDSENIWKQIKQVEKWKRLFGGGGLVINTSQDPTQPFDIEKVNENTPIQFYPADLWELNMNYILSNPLQELNDERPYHFYGLNLHNSRVLKVKGKEAPSFIRRNLRGWGMTEVERLVRSINQYFKNQDVIFELLDEAKVDVYKISGFNSALMSAEGTAQAQKRVMTANGIKNFLNALVMDIEDEYEQKQMQFAGLGEMLKQIREGIASDLRMPVTKLFGISSAGFNSGEDDLENYNAMVESEERAKVKFLVISVMKILCKKLFGIIPEDLSISFEPLRILSSEQEQSVKTSELNRVLNAFTNGLIDSQTAKEAINSKDLLPIKIDTSDENLTALNI